MKLIHGDCLTDFTYEKNTISCIVTDPPYGEGMGFDGDTDIKTAEDLLRSASRLWLTALKPNGFVAVFWASRSVDVALDVLRSEGFTFKRILNMYIPRGGARPYRAWLPRTQPILLMQKYLPKPPPQAHTELCDVLVKHIVASGYTKSKLASILGCNSRLIMKWTRKDDPAWCLPTPRFYGKLKQLLSLPDEFDYYLTREPQRGQSRDYVYKHDTYVVDEKIAEFFEHPCQKPLSVLTHLVDSLTDVGDIVLDPFMGSGSTGVACLNTGRHFIGIEKDDKYFAVASERIAKHPPAELCA